jgi:hypothetical protein
MRKMDGKGERARRSRERKAKQSQIQSQMTVIKTKTNTTTTTTIITRPPNTTTTIIIITTTTTTTTTATYHQRAVAPRQRTQLARIRSIAVQFVDVEIAIAVVRIVQRLSTWQGRLVVIVERLRKVDGDVEVGD